MQILGKQIEYIFYPLGRKEKVQKLLDDDKEAADWENIRTRDDVKNDDRVENTYCFLDINPTNMCFIDEKILIVTDRRSFVKVIDVPGRSIIKTYCKHGGDAGDITEPLAIDYFKLEEKNITFFAICEGITM